MNKLILGLAIAAAFVLGISGVEGQKLDCGPNQVFQLGVCQDIADLIDFETGFVDEQIVTVVPTATNTVTFGVSPCATPGTAFIAETGTPITAYLPGDDIPAAASGGSFFLTDQTAGAKATLDYCISFATPVNNLSVDLYDYRDDGGASLGGIATLSGFDASGSPVGSVTFVIPLGTPDPNLATLSIQSPSDLISSAVLSFDSPDQGTGIDNIIFDTAVPGLSPIETIEILGNEVIVTLPNTLSISTAVCPSSHPFLIGGTYQFDILASQTDLVQYNMVPKFDIANNAYEVTLQMGDADFGSVRVAAIALCANFP